MRQHRMAGSSGVGRTAAASSGIGRGPLRRVPCQVHQCPCPSGMDKEMTLWRRLDLRTPQKISKNVGTLKFYQCSTEGQKYHQILAPVLVIISGHSLVFSRKITTSTASTGFTGAGPRRISTSSVEKLLSHRISMPNMTGRPGFQTMEMSRTNVCRVSNAMRCWAFAAAKRLGEKWREICWCKTNSGHFRASLP